MSYWDDIYNESMNRAVRTRDIKREVVNSGVLGRAPSGQQVNSYLQGLRKGGQQQQQPTYRNYNPGTIKPPAQTSTRRSGGGGGGGGGGAPANPFDQGRMDQIAALLGGGRPQAQTASTVDLPDYQAPTRAAFDPSMYQRLGGEWNQAVQQDLGTAQKAGDDLLSFLTSNYSNAYTNGNNTYAQAGQAPGQSIGQLQQLLQSQGVDPSILAAAYGERVGADQAFGNMWRSNAAASDTQHQGNLARAKTDQQNWLQGINAQGRAGTAQIGLAQGQAQNRYNERGEEFAREDAMRANDIAMQEAMANWQRSNQVSDQNQSSSDSYRNSTIQALLGLLGTMPAGVNIPTLQALGLA